jgi:hypothetical protein
VSDEKGTNRFQIGVAAAGVLVTALLGFGQWNLSRQQREAEERRSEDNIEVQVMALVKEHLAKLRGSGEDAENAQRVVLAAGKYLADGHHRPALIIMYDSIVKDLQSVKTELKTQAAESTEPAAEGAKWYAVLASLPANDLSRTRSVASQMLAHAQQLGFTQGIKVYKTKISNNYAIVMGGQMSRSDAFSLAADARQKSLATDAFPQQDRSWEFILDASSK